MSETIPDGFPSSTADVQLALSLVAEQHSNELISLVQRLYHGYWAEGNSTILSADGFSVILERQLGPEPAQHIVTQVSWYTIS